MGLAPGKFPGACGAAGGEGQARTRGRAPGPPAVQRPADYRPAGRAVWAAPGGTLPGPGTAWPAPFLTHAGGCSPHVCAHSAAFAGRGHRTGGGRALTARGGARGREAERGRSVVLRRILLETPGAPRGPGARSEAAARDTPSRSRRGGDADGRAGERGQSLLRPGRSPARTPPRADFPACAHRIPRGGRAGRPRAPGDAAGVKRERGRAWSMTSPGVPACGHLLGGPRRPRGAERGRRSGPKASARRFQQPWRASRFLQAATHQAAGARGEETAVPGRGAARRAAPSAPRDTQDRHLPQQRAAAGTQPRPEGHRERPGGRPDAGLPASQGADLLLRARDSGLAGGETGPETLGGGWGRRGGSKGHARPA